MNDTERIFKQEQIDIKREIFLCISENVELRMVKITYHLLRSLTIKTEYYCS